MRNEERNKLHSESTLYYRYERLKNGFKEVYTNPVKAFTIITYLIITTISLWFYNNKYMTYMSGLKTPLSDFCCVLITIIAGIVFFIIIYAFSAPIKTFQVNRNLRRIGLANQDAHESPRLLKQYSAPDENCYIMEFYSIGIPLETWENKQAEIESVLGIYIIRVKEGYDRKHILLYAVDYDTFLQPVIPWNNAYLSENEFELALGKSVLGTEYANLDIVSHALIAGSTGSGKTVQLKCLMYQCLKKGAKVILVDYKGGANFTKIWKKHLDIITTDETLNNMLDEVRVILNDRKELLDKADCENIIEYNKTHIENKLQRYIICFDEVGEALDKSGLTSDAKKDIYEIEYKISTLARLGRAFGIHLILGMQRPDAKVLTGQIKSNIDLRMCGRSDDVLSQIVLDTTDASRKIKDDERGRFVLGNGKLIQAFYFTDEDME